MNDFEIDLYVLFSSPYIQSPIETPPETLKAKIGTDKNDDLTGTAVEWTVEGDLNDPWAMEDNWAEEPEPETSASPYSLARDSMPGNYYDYVASKRASALPYEENGSSNLYVEDLEFMPTEFNEYDDTAEFAY